MLADREFAMGYTQQDEMYGDALFRLTPAKTDASALRLKVPNRLVEAIVLSSFESGRAHGVDSVDRLVFRDPQVRRVACHQADRQGLCRSARRQSATFCCFVAGVHVHQPERVSLGGTGNGG